MSKTFTISQENLKAATTSMRIIAKQGSIMNLVVTGKVKGDKVITTMSCVTDKKCTDVALLIDKPEDFVSDAEYLNVYMDASVFLKNLEALLVLSSDITFKCDNTCVELSVDRQGRLSVPMLSDSEAQKYAKLYSGLAFKGKEALFAGRVNASELVSALKRAAMAVERKPGAYEFMGNVTCTYANGKLDLFSAQKAFTQHTSNIEVSDAKEKQSGKEIKFAVAGECLGDIESIIGNDDEKIAFTANPKQIMIGAHPVSNVTVKYTAALAEAIVSPVIMEKTGKWECDKGISQVVVDANDLKNALKVLTATGDDKARIMIKVEQDYLNLSHKTGSMRLPLVDQDGRTDGFTVGFRLQFCLTIINRGKRFP